MIKWAQADANRYQQQLLGPSLDEQIGADHGVRVLDEMLRELDWSEWEAQYGRDGAGRPPIHPRLMAGCILYGLLKRIRSTRDLEEATRMRLDFRWLMDGMTVDHTTFCVFRNTFKKQIGDIFKQLNRRAASLKKATIEEVIIDGTRIRADSDRHGARTAQSLEKRLAALDQEISEGLEKMEQSEDDWSTDMPREQLETHLRRLDAERAKLLQALSVANQRDEAKRQKDGKGCRAVRVPVGDPDASIMPNKEGGYAPNYTPVAAVDSDGLIVATTIADGNAEAATVGELMEQVGEIGGRSERLLVDGGFSTGENLEQMKEDGVEVYAPVASGKDNPALRSDPTTPVSESEYDALPTRGSRLDRSAFVYDPEEDCYYCPMGRRMPFAQTVNRKSCDSEKISVRIYRCTDCGQCPLFTKCVKGKAKRRSLSRDQYEELREELAARMSTQEGKDIYARRAPTGERVFATIKSSLGIRRFSVRGKDKVTCEWLWVCTAHNLKKLILQRGGSAKKKDLHDREALSRPETRPSRHIARLHMINCPHLVGHDHALAA